MIHSSDSIDPLSLRLAVLLLAAGEGSRMGSRPKALLKRGDHTLLESCIEAVQPFSPVEFVLLTGFHAELIENYLIDLKPGLNCPIRVVRNVAPERGQASSVRLGLESLKSDFDVLLIFLSDQPEITDQEIAQLMRSYIAKSVGKEIVLPMVSGQRGNPVLLSRQAIANILETPGLACRPYMDAHPEKICSMETDNRAFVVDVDTVDDIQKQQLE
jgi:molybdenum cofactor cytidylyltransferase